MWNNEVLNNIEQKFKAQPPLFIETGGKVYENLHDFLYHFFDVLNCSYETKLADGTVDTLPNKNRSLSDIYRICLQIFPNLTVKELIKELHNPVWWPGFHNYDKTKDCINTLFCSNINKQIYNLYNKKNQSNIGRFHSIFTESGNHYTYPLIKVDENGLSDNDIIEIVNS